MKQGALSDLVVGLAVTGLGLMTVWLTWVIPVTPVYAVVGPKLVPAVIAAALPLLAWVALFHAADAVQCIASFVLRAYRIATLPMLIFAVSLWGVGLGGGYLLAFDVTGLTPPALRGARGFWVASTSGLVLAATALSGLLWWVLRRQSRDEAAALH